MQSIFWIVHRRYLKLRQTGRVALWQAWTRFDTEKGNFTPFAYRSIRVAVLDE
ncbi:sigma factor [Sporosarcina sp. YIM B06819]|uniref:sigma factor n=1 Tax=Sporosarcina sp. YIM B06819 TaxID=3081769 RepID=UPI0039942D29